MEHLLSSRTRRAGFGVVVAAAALVAPTVLAPVGAGAAVTSGAADAAAPARHRAATCAGRAATIVGFNTDDTLRGTRRADVIVAKGGADTIKGRGGNDIICAGPGADTVITGGGTNKVLAGGGGDIVIGGPGTDRMRGDGGIDALLGAGGNDVYDGGADLDIGAFLSSPHAVVANIAAGSASGEGADTLTGIEVLAGSAAADTLVGDGGVNGFFASGGADTFKGAGGVDFAFFTLLDHGVTVDLATGTTSEGVSLTGIENVVGSDHDDDLTGTAAYNQLVGGAGTDVINGNGGDDDCDGETVTGCRVEVTYGEEGPPVPDNPPPGARTQLADADAAGPMRLLRSLSGTSKAGRTSPQLAAAVPPPPADAPPLPARLGGTATGERRDSQWVWCPMLSSYATVTAPAALPGYGYVAYRIARPLTGWDPFVTHGWLYLEPSSYWEYLGGQWLHTNGAAQYNVYVGTGLIVDAYYWYSADNQWYSLGSCQGHGVSLGFSVG